MKKNSGNNAANNASRNMSKDKCQNKDKNQNKQIFLIIIVIAIVLAILAPFLASSNPDGLDATLLRLVGGGDEEVVDEMVAENNALDYNAPISGYSIDGMGKAGEVGSILGGTLLILGLTFGLSRIMKKKCNCRK